MSSDTEYLKDTVGDALALGCAATMKAAPADPVEYLALWLRKYVENDHTLAQLEKDREEAKGQELEARAEASIRAREAAMAEEQREAALSLLASSQDDNLWALWQQALEVITTHTAASAAYVASVSQPEEPEPSAEEPEGAEPGTGPTEESDFAPYVEPDAPPPAEPAAEGAEEGEAAEGGDAGDAPAGEGAAEGGAPPAPPPPKVFDYAAKFLEFVAAAGPGGELAESERVQRRPPPTPEGEEPPVPPPRTPLLFSVLDQGLRSIYYPDAVLAHSFKFPSDFPRPGAFAARSLITADKEIKAIICADTMVPAGSGVALSDPDRQFIARVAEAVEASMAAQVARFAEAAAALAEGAKQRRRDLQSKLEETLAALDAPPPPPEGTEPPADAAAPPPPPGPPATEASSAAEGSEGAAPVDDDPPPPEVPPEEAPPPAEGEAAAEGGEGGEAAEPAPRDAAKELEKAQKKVERAQALVARAAWESRQAAKKSAAADKDSTKQSALLSIVSEYYCGLIADAKLDLGGYTTSPPLTTRALRAAAIVLERSGAALGGWTGLREAIIGSTLLEELAYFSPIRFLSLPEAERKRVRAHLRGLATPEAAARLDAEAPRSSIGSATHRLLGQIRAAALALGALRAAEEAAAAAAAKAEGAEKALQELSAQIEALTAEVAEAEEQARLASEAAAAAGAEAAPPAEGEGEAGAEGEEEAAE